MAATVAPGVPTHRAGITPAWLTSALRSSGVITPDTRVIACPQHPVVAVTVSGDTREDGGGLSGPQIVRLRLTYAGGTGPAQLIAKFGNWQDTHQMPAWPLKSRLLQVLGRMRLEEQFRSEVRFFQHIAPHLRGILLPKVYYAALSDARNAGAWAYVLFDRRTPLRFCVLMEDLALNDFMAARPGESLPGARATQALRNIAQLHAFGWQNPRLWAHLQLRPAPWLPFLRADEGLQRRQRDKFLRTNVIPTFLHRWAHHRRQGNHPQGFALLRQPEMVAMLTALNASFATWAAEANTTARLAPQTIVHGDFHGGNHLFTPRDACRVVDFQFVGTGRVADELAYFFMLSFDPDPDAEEHLLHCYHDALVAAGVHDYPAAQLLHEYHVATLTLLLGSLVRAIKFLTPAAYDKMGRDPKQADLMQLGDVARDRLMLRAFHWYHTPPLRHTFFPVDRLGP
jgi:Ecdysteroid kinase-like family